MFDLSKGLPEKVHVCGLDFEVVLCEESDFQGSDHIGELWYNELQIRILKTSSEEVKKSTLLHEIVEAWNLIYEMNLSHKTITTLENSIYQFLKFN